MLDRQGVKALVLERENTNRSTFKATGKVCEIKTAAESKARQKKKDA